MKNRQILLNALTTLLQVIGNAAILFFLYRFLIRAIGIERLGIWSLVLATTSVVTLANQGFSTSIVKFVAKYAARKSPDEICSLVETALISIGVPLSFAIVALYPGAKWVLHALLPPAAVPEAFAILPFALATLWINVAASILQAGLVGHELITECNYVDFATSALYLGLAVWLVPRDGLVGLAYAQLAQSALYSLSTWLLLKRCLPGLSLIPVRWNRRLFREAFSYGVHFQFITAAQALREPVTKALLTKFGGLAMTGFYDLASRLVVTLREMLVQSSQVLIPTVSSLQESDPQSIPTIYRESYRLIFFLAVPSFACLFALSPLISLIWIGRYEPVFILFVALLTAGWLINVLSNPSYVVDLGTGALRSVSIGCAVTALLNAVLGFASGKFVGGTAIVATSAFSLILGYVIVTISYHVANRVRMSLLLPPGSTVILLSSLFGAAIFFPLLRGLSVHSLLSLRTVVLTLGAFTAILFVPMWIHPMRRRLMNWVFAKVPA